MLLITDPCITGFCRRENCYFCQTMVVPYLVRNDHVNGTGVGSGRHLCHREPNQPQTGEGSRKKIIFKCWSIKLCPCFAYVGQNEYFHIWPLDIHITNSSSIFVGVDQQGHAYSDPGPLEWTRRGETQPVRLQGNPHYLQGIKFNFEGPLKRYLNTFDWITFR